MSDLVRIVYVSRSTFPPRPAEHGIEPGVARILTQSRMNNPRRGLVGALYFRDGCFFQCLEGPGAEIDRLMATLRADPRHTDLRVLSRQPIDRTGFAGWSMKYADIDQAMSTLLRAWAGDLRPLRLRCHDGRGRRPAPAGWSGRRGGASGGARDGRVRCPCAARPARGLHGAGARRPRTRRRGGRRGALSRPAQSSTRQTTALR